MKGNRMYVDIGTMLDEIFEAAKDFSDKMKDLGPEFAEQWRRGPGGPAGGPGGRGPDSPGQGGPWADFAQDENADYYPSYSYPPMNNYLTPERSLVFEFALAGFDEKDISLTFQGDYMVFAAKIGEAGQAPEGVRYFKRRLKLKDVEKQKYYVPADKFAQEKVKAVFRNGILKVVVPPKDEAEANEGIRIEILKDGE
jgi:HSP20 family molecular chaperone IbpA